MGIVSLSEDENRISEGEIMKNQVCIFRQKHFWAYFTDLPVGGLKKWHEKVCALSVSCMTPSELFHGCVSTRRTDTDIKLPDSFQ